MSDGTRKDIFDREIELQKVQALMSYFQTRMSIAHTVIYAFIAGFLIFISGLYYQGSYNFSNQPNNSLTGRLDGLVIFVIILFGFFFAMRPSLHRLNKRSDDCLEIIDKLYVKIDSGESLPSIVELKKIAYSENNQEGKWLKANQTKEKSERSSVDEQEKAFARLQADIQIWLTACFALIVLLATCALGAWQIITTPTADLPKYFAPVQQPIFFLIAIAGLASGAGTLYSYLKMNECRRKMDKY